MNAMLKTRIAIVTPKPQTTRDQILGILTRPGFQVLFQDTPGLFEMPQQHPPSSLPQVGVLAPKGALKRRMLAEALKALTECDVALVLSDARDFDTFRADDGPVIERVRDAGRPVVVVITKVDLLHKPSLLPLIDGVARLFAPEAIVPVSALTGEGLEGVLNEVVARLPEGPPLYPAEQVSDRPLRFLAAEIIREKVMLFTHQEVPYSIAVQIVAFEEGRPPGPAKRRNHQHRVTRISANIVVERPSQKRIVIGKEGAMIRRIGTAAREDIEALLSAEDPKGRRCKVFLDLFVRVEPGWTKSEDGLRRVEG